MGFLVWTDTHGVTHFYRTLSKEVMDRIEEACRTLWKGVLDAPMPEGSYVYVEAQHASVKLPPKSSNYTLCDVMAPADIPFPRSPATCLLCITMNQLLEEKPWLMVDYT